MPFGVVHILGGALHWPGAETLMPGSPLVGGADGQSPLHPTAHLPVPPHSGSVTPAPCMEPPQDANPHPTPTTSPHRAIAEDPPDASLADAGNPRWLKLPGPGELGSRLPADGQQDLAAAPTPGPGLPPLVPGQGRGQRPAPAIKKLGSGLYEGKTSSLLGRGPTENCTLWTYKKNCDTREHPFQTA